MRRSMPIIAVMIMLLFIGLRNLLHYSQELRPMVVAGLFTGGMAFGVAWVGILLALFGKLRRREDKVSADLQRSDSKE